MSEDEPPKTPEVEMEESQTESMADEPITEEETVTDVKDNEISSLKQKIATLESDIANREEKIKNLEGELNQLKEDTKDIKANEANDKEKIKDLEHRLSQKELEITRLEGSVEDLSIAKKKIEDLQKEHKKLEEEMRAYQKMGENEPRFIILKDLDEFGEMRLNQVSMKAGVSPAQAKKWLDELERAGLVEIHGEGRDSNPIVSRKKK
ncbi:MAG: hypothetical protein FK734_06295 [Asgard group archaeon]|nr:hypothetical protein [Asgard group archaeon]